MDRVHHTDSPDLLAEKTLGISQQVDKPGAEPGRDVDEALYAIAGSDGQPLVLDDAAKKRILRRIDMILLPLMCIVNGLNYLDQSSLSYVSVLGFQEDVGISTSEYSWLGSIIFFGLLAWQWPTNRLLQILPRAKYLGFCITMWGVVLACTAVVRGFGGAMALRFFLGALEASTIPGFMLLTSQWYTKEEHGVRTSIWFCFNASGPIIGGAMAYALAKDQANHDFSIAAWKLVFIINGCMTVFFGILFLIVVPDTQLNCWWLSKQDRKLAVERVRVNQQGIGNKKFKMYQFKEALTDPMTWAFAFVAIVLDIPNGGVSNYFALLITSFGYDADRSLLLGMPSGAIGAGALLVWGIVSRKTGYRILWSVFFVFIALVGFIVIVAVPVDRPGGRLAGYYMYSLIVVGFVSLLSLLSSNIAGYVACITTSRSVEASRAVLTLVYSYTKKTTVAAIYIIAFAAGNIIGPQTFRNNDYRPAEITIVVCIAASLVTLTFIHFYYVRQNAKKAAFRRQPGYEKVKNVEFLDLTDKENPEFNYVL